MKFIEVHKGVWVLCEVFETSEKGRKNKILKEEDSAALGDLLA